MSLIVLHGAPPRWSTGTTPVLRAIVAHAAAPERLEHHTIRSVGTPRRAAIARGKREHPRARPGRSTRAALWAVLERDEVERCEAWQLVEELHLRDLDAGLVEADE